MLLLNILPYILTTILIIWGIVWFYFKHCFNYWANRGVPFPKPEFFYGNLKQCMLFKKTIGEEFTELYNEYKSQGQRYFGAYFFHEPMFVVTDLQLVKNVMSKDFEYFAARKVYYNEESDPLSAHLISLEGLKWKHLRQKLTPTFTSGKLKYMFQTLVDCTEDLTSCLDKSVAASEPIDIRQVCAQYTTDVIGSVAFGIDCNSFQNPNSDFIKMGSKNFNPEFWDRIKVFFAIVFPSVAKFFNMRITNKEADRFYRNLVKDTVEFREKKNITRNDFLQLLIELNKNGGETEDSISPTLTMNEVAAQTFLFFIAGFETSSTLMTFCLYELSKNPDIQQKLREEIVNVLKKHDGIITYDSVMEMQYMERVILETLRKHPPFMALQRKVTKEYSVPGSNIVLEKDMMVFIPVLALHKDPEFYPEPEKFDPDRFTEKNKATRPNFTFMPFGEGPRICIGLRFGLMETKVGLCKLLLSYKFSLNPKTHDPLILDPASIVSSVKDGVWLNAEKLNY